MTILTGLYRATVINDQDSYHLGQVEITIDSMPNEPAHWAMPCVPYAGANVGLALIPAVGSKVWVGFEGGDVSLPVWLGAFWDSAQLPAPADQNPMAKVLRTAFGALIIDEDAQTLTVETPSGQLGIEVDATSATISGSPSLQLSGPNDTHIRFASGVITIKGWPLGFETPTDATLARITELEAKVAALEAAAQGT